ncbi:MAG: phosphoglycerate kinase, partial [Simkaniaceae bacterium]|nr:phosphoglycerate kinase [Simkaniaceae bacterium]
TLTNLLTAPDRPFYAIVGGAKVGSKIGVLRSLADKVDHLFIGGGMAYTFLQTQGITIGDSIFDRDNSDVARALLTSHGDKISLPEDFIITDGSAIKTITIADGIPDGWEGMDIGPATLKKWSEKLGTGKTVFWNGPVGVFENPNFALGTEKIAHLLADLGGTTIAGGGDSIAAIQKCHLVNNFTHISTGGGACLELIEFGTLPALEQM